MDGLDFEIDKGSFIGIIGENGAGKSTLCQAFNGLVPGFFKGAYGGKVLIGDTEVAKTTVSKLCQKVGLVFQNPFNQLTGAKETVFEEIAFGLQNFGVLKEEMISRVNEVMELLDIADYRDRNPFDLSGGQMQRGALAGILAMKPEVIVLDEPTSQLDPAGSEEVFAAVDKLTKSGLRSLWWNRNWKNWQNTVTGFCGREFRACDCYGARKSARRRHKRGSVCTEGYPGAGKARPAVFDKAVSAAWV